jgi:hypothetical protein
MDRLRLYGFILGVFVIASGCSDRKWSEELGERIRQSTLSQISDIKNGKTKALHDPAPSLIEDIVCDASCVERIESLDFSDFRPDIADPRYGSLQHLPHLKSVYFYCTNNTDTFLSRIAGMVSLEALETELADVSDAGMTYVAQCPNLKKLVLYGGRPSVGNAGLAQLEGHEKLETLELINTNVTNDGLVSLTKLPNLKSLVLFWEAVRGERLTDAGLKRLNNLSKLVTLELSGGWVSENAVEELRLQLPECKIDTQGSH